MPVPILAATLAFVASLAGAAWLGRLGRGRLAFAAMVGAPLIAASVYAGSSAAHRSEAAVESTGASPHAGAGPQVMASDVDGWRRRAEELRSARRFPEARALYEKVAEAAPSDPDSWADLADASAAAAGGDLTAGRDAIDRALALDPNHLKALWLDASLELQQKNYAKAAELWQRLLTLLPADSSDARIVRANLEETRALASPQGARR